MTQKNTFLQKALACSIIILLFPAVFIGYQSFASEDSSRSKQSSIVESMKYSDEMQDLKKATLQQRKELIEKLINIIIADRDYSETFAAIDILGQIRAIETTDFLLDNVDYRVPESGMFSSIDPIKLKRRYPVVKALIDIRPPNERIMKKLTNTDGINIRSCDLAILIGIEGVDVTRYIIEKTIDTESDEHKLSRLKSALNMLNKEFPIKDKKEK